MTLSFNRGSLSLGVKLLGVSMVCLSMASCATTSKQEAQPKKARSKEYFSEKEYGVKASPRVVGEGQPVPKGGGRFMVGDPYQVKGKTYVPKEDPNYNKSGLASWYGSAFHGRYTANGEIYDSAALTAAHPTFPLPSYARVTNLENGSSVIVRVNDRGPYHEGRILDVSGKTAELLDMKRTGTAKVNVQYVGRARMDGEDMPFLMASYIRKGDRLPNFNPGGQIASGVMVASNQSLGDQLQSYGSSLPQPYPAAQRPTKPAVASAQPAKPAAKPAAAPSFAPQVAERPVASSSRVAMAAPVAPMPAAMRPTPSRSSAAPAARAAVNPAPVVAAAKPAVEVSPARFAQARPAEASTRTPSADSAATAYVSAPKSKGPQVMFGGVLLQD